MCPAGSAQQEPKAQPLPFMIDVQEIEEKITMQCDPIPAELDTEGLLGGVLCTGFVDAEKVIRKIEPPDPRTGRQQVKVWFLEKMLPFQVLMLRLPDQEIPGVTCPIFFPRSAGFFQENFFRAGTLTDSERSCAIACVESRSAFMTRVLTEPVDQTPGCPVIPLTDCQTTVLGQDCINRINALLHPTTVGNIVAAICGQTIQPPIGQMTRQFFAVLLNVCLCAVGAQGPVGGVLPGQTVNLSRKPEPVRTAAIAVFGTATPTVQQVINEAERILNLFCSTGTVDANADTVQEVLAEMAQENGSSIIEP